jgi:hypothetical protein
MDRDTGQPDPPLTRLLQVILTCRLPGRLSADQTHLLIKGSERSQSAHDEPVHVPEKRPKQVMKVRIASTADNAALGIDRPPHLRLAARWPQKVRDAIVAATGARNPRGLPYVM